MLCAIGIAHSLFHLDVPIIEKVVRALLVYAFLVVGLRLAGKRELGQLNTLDFVVLLAVANAVQNGIIGNDNTVTGAVVGASVLFGVNALMAALIFRSVRARKLVEGSATVLIEDGVFIEKALRHEKICKEDLLAAIAQQGASDVAEVERAVLEPNGAIVTMLKTPDYETQHFLALSQQIAELKTIVEQRSDVLTVAELNS
ncbi:MAG TPA: YetF domain-containing protein [Acidimicrobiia bacterium]|nr:YetF domain-containing protein [Acidimicrobiia bacterium]